MVAAITEGIEVRVETQYAIHESRPEQSRYIWQYRITIVNQSNATVQLQRRHWYIYDSLLARREVKGEGVVGKKPTLGPGMMHQYSSWCPFESEIGMMSGYFEMIRESDQKTISVKVPSFTMITPNRLN